MYRGYIKFWRKTIDNFISSNPEALALWVHLLILASHKGTEFMFNGKKQPLARGQFITGRKKLSMISGISESKVFRLLKCFESEQLIEQQNMHKFSLISIKNYNKYQNNEQQNEHEMNSQRTASEQPVNTFNNDKNVEELKEIKKIQFIPKDFQLSNRTTVSGIITYIQKQECLCDDDKKNITIAVQSAAKQPHEIYELWELTETMIGRLRKVKKIIVTGKGKEIRWESANNG